MTQKWPTSKSQNVHIGLQLFAEELLAKHFPRAQQQSEAVAAGRQLPANSEQIESVRKGPDFRGAYDLRACATSDADQDSEARCASTRIQHPCRLTAPVFRFVPIKSQAALYAPDGAKFSAQKST